MTDQKEPARFSRQASPIFLVPGKDEFEESKDILSVRWVVEVMVWRRLPGREPIVGKCDREPCGHGEPAGQGRMISLVFPDGLSRFQCDRGRMKMDCLTLSRHPRG